MATLLECSYSAHFGHPVRYSLRRSVLRSFSSEKTRFHREYCCRCRFRERACRLCVDVNKSLLSNNSSILESNDQTPVPVANFGVQAL